MMPGFGGMGAGMGSGMMWASLLLNIVAIVAIVALLVVVLGRLRGQDAVVGGGSALDILGRRFARGEIDQATYDRMRERLGGTATGQGESVPAPR